MNCSLRRLKTKMIEIRLKDNKNDVFNEIEKIDKRTLYHTKIFNDFFAFGISKKEENKFFISLRNLFNKGKRSRFHLFSIKENIDDKFLGMFYGFKRLRKPIYFKYKNNNTKDIETVPMYKIYYIEFRFKRGSIFCYIRAIHSLTKKEKFNKNYAQNLLKRIINLEYEVYEFYNETPIAGGIITKWIKRNQK
ncbi:DUF226 domain-containing protein (plasmid) [Borrelia recurrentis]|uniref:Plasmid partitioning associated protein-1 n=1 Tax=Borrelia recurrentis (strain A1) TaxID=412418 RepID=B5RS81_BORRA|nr:DUF226 domain-containing protein [Borrelia recurrentis]ACH95217.1 plasmid partitioning associated protein-1 [Borrelia recurrentis A1]ACH95245.1 plasmid partitioning associated protein-1 [Borrelia recurrentis A1]